MFESEDGTLTGSIDVSRLDQVEPKSDEAKAQIEQLKAEAQASQEQATTDAERLAALHEAQSAQGVQGRPVVTTQGDQWGDPNAAAVARGEGDAARDRSAEDRTAKREQDAKDKAAADQAKSDEPSRRSGKQG